MSWKPMVYAPGHATLGAPPPATVLAMGITPTVKELRRLAVNTVLPLWSKLRDTVNAECQLPEASFWDLVPTYNLYRRTKAAIAPPRLTDIASAEEIPQWCWDDTEVQAVLLDFVSNGRSWVAQTNALLETYGDELLRTNPQELHLLGEEFDKISIRLTAVSNFTLENPVWVFFKTLPDEIRKRGEEMFKKGWDFWPYLGVGVGVVATIWVLWRYF